MRFSSTQTAFASLAVKFGETVRLIRSFRTADHWRELQRQLKDENQNEKRPWNLRVVQLAGESDILLAFDFKRFQHLFEANAHFGRRHLSCHWTLCKSFETELIEVGQVPREYLTAEHTCFYIHLRLYRQIYRHAGSTGEALILAELERRLKDMDIPASLHASLGWTDILVEGYLPAGRQQLSEVLQSLQSISYDLDGREVCPFQRTITRVGYRWDLEHEPKGSTTDPFLLRLRVKPGQVVSAGRKLKQIFSVENKTRPRILLTEGKTDILMVPAEDDGPYRNIHLAQDAREAFLQLREAGVEYLECYLATNALTAIIHPELPAPDRCSCRAKTPHLQLTREQERRIPSSIYMSIRRIHELLATALRDPLQCCDILPLTEALHQSLDFMLAGLWALQEAEGNEAERYAWERRKLRELSRWCETAESVLDERTNETFHEADAQSTRLGALRGNVQKLLLTGDYLVREFVDRIQEHLAIDRALAPPVFYYGATDEISIRSGVVTIPGKYLFALPLSIPQLWQESGVWVFNQLYPVPTCPVTRDRLIAYSRAEERHYNDLTQLLIQEIDRLRADGEESPGTADTYKSPEERLDALRAEKARISPPDILLGDIADHYADLLVRFIGFQDWRQFLKYSVTLVLGSHKYKTAPVALQKQYWQAVAQRLLFVLECEEILSRHPAGLLDRERGHYEGVPVDKDTVDHARRCEYIGTMIKEVEITIRHLLSRPAWLGQAELLEDEIFAKVAARATRESYYLCQWQYMWDFIGRVRKTMKKSRRPLPTDFFQGDGMLGENLRALRNAEVSDLSSGPFLNAYYSVGYLEEVSIRSRETPDEALRKPQRNLAGMVALGRSVMLASYRRQSHQAVEPT